MSSVYGPASYSGSHHIPLDEVYKRADSGEDIGHTSGARIGPRHDPNHRFADCQGTAGISLKEEDYKYITK